MPDRLRELIAKWRRDANALRLRAPNAGSEYEQGAIMGRSRQLEETADESEHWLEKVLHNASEEVKSWPDWLKDKEHSALRKAIHAALGAQHLSIDGRELNIVIAAVCSQLEAALAAKVAAVAGRLSMRCKSNAEQVLADALAAEAERVRRKTLEEACMAQCGLCNMKVRVVESSDAEKSYGMTHIHLWHGPDGRHPESRHRCDAQKIRALADKG